MIEHLKNAKTCQIRKFSRRLMNYWRTITSNPPPNSTTHEQRGSDMPLINIDISMIDLSMIDLAGIGGALIPAFGTGTGSSDLVQLGITNTETWIREAIELSKKTASTPEEAKRNTADVNKLIEKYHTIERQFPAAKQEADNRIAAKPNIEAPKHERDQFLKQMKTVREIHAKLEPDKAHPSTKTNTD